MLGSWGERWSVSSLFSVNINGAQCSTVKCSIRRWEGQDKHHMVTKLAYMEDKISSGMTQRSKQQSLQTRVSLKSYKTHVVGGNGTRMKSLLPAQLWGTGRKSKMLSLSLWMVPDLKKRKWAGWTFEEGKCGFEQKACTVRVLPHLQGGERGKKRQSDDC